MTAYKMRLLKVAEDIGVKTGNKKMLIKSAKVVSESLLICSYVLMFGSVLNLYMASLQLTRMPLFPISIKIKD